MQPIKYTIGVDFKEDEYRKWTEQLIWWIGDRMPNVPDPREHAEKILKAARYGTKLDGGVWPNVTQDFFKRVIALSGFDVKHGVGVRDPRSNAPRRADGRGRPSEPVVELPPLDIGKAIKLRDEYIGNLLSKYPHLDTPVYKPKVEELAETIVKSRMISNDFVTARGKQLESLSKIRESLHKQMGELMEFLEISPKQRVQKTLEAKNADVGSLIAKLESYGEVWQEYEKIDAVRELIQLYRMLKSTRPDGTPQLNDWEVWHMTRSKPITFTCRHGETYELIGGFTAEEIEKALLQANEVYGFGLEPIGEHSDKPIEVTDTIATEEILEALPSPKDEEEDVV